MPSPADGHGRSLAHRRLLSLLLAAMLTAADAVYYLNSIGLPWPGSRAEVRAVVNPTQSLLRPERPQPVSSSADSTQLGFVNGIAAADDGVVFFTDANASTVSRLGTDGTVTLVAGIPFVPGANCSGTCFGRNVALQSPIAVAIQPGNPFRSIPASVLIADKDACVIYALNATGFIRVALGLAGSCAVTTPNTAASAALLFRPAGVAASGEFSSALGSPLPFVWTEPLAQRVMIQRASYINALAMRTTPASPAAAAMLCPTGVILDIAAQAAYVSDPCAHIVLRFGIGWDAVGIPALDTIIAGTPYVAGYSGDAGLAASATLWSPFGLALTLRGSLLIAESGDPDSPNPDATPRIRVVLLGTSNTTTLIYSLAGGKVATADGANSSAPVLAADARLRNLRQLAAMPRAGAQGVYYATEGRRIVIVYTNPPPAAPGSGTCSSGLLRALAGPGVPASAVVDVDGSGVNLLKPQSVAVHSLTGDVYVSDAAAHVVRRLSVDKNSGRVNISTVIGIQGNSTPMSRFADGLVPARSYTLSVPLGLAIDSVYDRLFIVDSNASAVRVVDLRNGSVRTAIGGGGSGHAFDNVAAFGAGLPRPSAVAYDPATRYIYVAEQYSYAGDNTTTIRIATPDNVIGTLAGLYSGAYSPIADGAAALRVRLRTVPAMHWDFPSATMYLVDYELQIALAVQPDGRLRVLASNATLLRPVGIVYAARSGSTFITEEGGALMELRSPAVGGARVWLIPRPSTGGSSVFVYGSASMPLPNSFPLPDARLQLPAGMAAVYSTSADSMTLYAVDAGSARVLRAECDAPGPPVVPGSTCDASVGSQVTVASLANIMGTPATADNPQASQVPAVLRRFALITGVNFAPDGRVFVVDQNASAVYVIQKDGTSSVYAGTPFSPGTSATQLNGPTSAVWDVAFNRLLITDTGNCAMRSVDGITGVMTRVLGSFGVCTRLANGTDTTLSVPTLFYPRYLAIMPVAATVWTEGDLAIDGGRVVAIVANILHVLTSPTFPGVRGGIIWPRAVGIQPASHSLFIADAGSHTVVRLALPSATAGMDTSDAIVVGTYGVPGWAGDAGAATDARLERPTGLVMTADGGFYIGELGSNRSSTVSESRVRYVRQDGTIFTVLGPNSSVPVNASYAQTPEVAAAVAAGLPNPQLTIPIALGIDPRVGTVYLGDYTRVLALACSPALIPEYSGGCLGPGSVLTRFAGNSSEVALTGTGGPALNAGLGIPFDVARDPASGDTFFSVGADHVIRRISAATGVIDTVIGTASQPAATVGADGAFADTVKISSPKGLHVDAANRRLLIAESGAHAVRAVSLRTGRLTTLVGRVGQSGSCGDGVAPLLCAIYNPFAVVYDAPSNTVMFTEAQVGNPSVGRVRAISNGAVRTVAGNFSGTAPAVFDGAVATNVVLSEVQSLAWDAPTRRLFMSCTVGQVVLVRRADGTINVLAGIPGSALGFGIGGSGVPASTTGLYYPTGIAFGGGSLFISETSSSVVREIRGIDSGAVPRIYTAVGTFATGAATPATLPASPLSVQLAVARGVAWDAAQRRLVIAECNAKRLLELVCQPEQPAQLRTVYTPACAGSLGTTVSTRLVANVTNNAAGTIVMYSNALAATPTLGQVRLMNILPAFARGQPITAIAVHGPSNTVYVSINDAANPSNSVVVCINVTSGTAAIIAGGGGVLGAVSDGMLATGVLLKGVSGLAIDEQAATGRRTLYVFDRIDCRIRAINETGHILPAVGTSASCFKSTTGTLTPAATVAYPFSGAASGDSELLVWTEPSSSRVVASKGGVIMVLADPGDPLAGLRAQLMAPRRIGLDPLAGWIYVADTNRNQVLRMGIPGSAVATATEIVAGTGGVTGFGDGGPALGADVRPADVDVLADGSILILDAGAAGNASGYGFVPPRLRLVNAFASQPSISTIAGPNITGMTPLGAAAVSPPPADQQLPVVSSGGANIEMWLPQGVAVDRRSRVAYFADGNRVLALLCADVPALAAGLGTCAGSPPPATMLPIHTGQLSNFQPASAGVAASGAVYTVNLGGTLTSIDPRTLNRTAVTGLTGLPPLTGSGGNAAMYTFGSILSLAVDNVRRRVVFSSSPLGRIYSVDMASSYATVVVGAGAGLPCADGTALLLCSINTPQAVAVDGFTGRIFFSDYYQVFSGTLYSFVRVADTDGIVRTVAGSYSAGYATAANGVAAKRVYFYDIRQLHFDAASQTLYIGDLLLNAVFSVALTPPSAAFGFSLGASAAAAISGSGPTLLRHVAGKINVTSGDYADGMLATQAPFGGYISGLAFSPRSGSLFISINNPAHVIREVRGGRIFTVTGIAGSMSVDLVPPNSLALGHVFNVSGVGYSEADNSLAIAETGAYRVVKAQCAPAPPPFARACSLPDALFKTMYGNTSTPELPPSIRGMAIDKATNQIFIAGSDGSISIADPAAGVNLVAGHPSSVSSGYAQDVLALTADLGGPTGLQFDDLGARLIFASLSFHRIMAITMADVTLRLVAGNGSVCTTPPLDGSPGATSCLSSPSDVALDPCTGDVYFTHADATVRVRRGDTGDLYTVAGRWPTTGTTVYGDAAPTATDLAPTGITWAPGRNALFIVEGAIGRIRMLYTDNTGTPSLTTIAGSMLVPIAFVTGIAGVYPAPSLKFLAASRVAVSGDLLWTYVQQAPAASVVEINIRTGVVSVVAGNGTSIASDVPAVSEIVSPHGLVAFDDKRGRLLISDAERRLIAGVSCPGANILAPPETRNHAAQCPAVAGGKASVELAVCGLPGVNATVLAYGQLSMGGGMTDSTPPIATYQPTPIGIEFANHPIANVFIAYSDSTVRALLPGNTAILRRIGIAGSSAEYEGDGIALTLSIGLVSAMAYVDSQQRLLIASSSYRLFSYTLINYGLTRLAGNGTRGLSPDGTVAGAAMIGAVADVAVDGCPILSTVYYIHEGESIRAFPLDSTGTIGGAIVTIVGVSPPPAVRPPFSSTTPALATALPFSGLRGLLWSPPSRQLFFTSTAGRLYRYDANTSTVVTVIGATGAIPFDILAEGGPAVRMLFPGISRPAYQNGTFWMYVGGSTPPAVVEVRSDGRWFVVTGAGRNTIGGLSPDVDTALGAVGAVAYDPNPGRLLVLNSPGRQLSQVGCPQVAGRAAPQLPVCPSATPSVSTTPASSVSSSQTQTPGAVSRSATVSVVSSMSSSRSPSISAARSSTSTPTAVASALPSGGGPGGGASATAFTTVLPFPSADAATPSASATDVSVVAASESITASATATPEPALPVPLQLNITFDGSLHSAHTGNGTAPVTTIVSRGWAPPRLRVRLISGCIPAAAATLRCAVDGSRGRSYVTTMLGFGFNPDAVSAGADRDDGVYSADGSVLVTPAAAAISGPDATAPGCLAWPSGGVAFSLHENRTGWAPEAASPLLDDDSVSVTGSSVLCSTPATARGYAAPATMLVSLRCDLVASATAAGSGTTSAASPAADASPAATAQPAAATSAAASVVMPGSLLWTASASALLMQAPLPVPLDILVLRPSRCVLESMRASGTTVPLSLRPEQCSALVSAFNGSASADAGMLATNATADSTAAGAGAGLAMHIGASTAIARAAAAHAARLAALGDVASSSASSSSSSSGSFGGSVPALSSATTLVILLSGRHGPHYPSPWALGSQAAAEAAADAAAAATSVNRTAAGSALASSSSCGSSTTAYPPFAALQHGLRLAVYVGGMRLNATYVSPDGSQVHVRVGSSAAVCRAAASSTASSTSAATGGSSSGAAALKPGRRPNECGYLPLRLQYEVDPDWKLFTQAATRNRLRQRVLTEQNPSAAAHASRELTSAEQPPSIAAVPAASPAGAVPRLRRLQTRSGTGSGPGTMGVQSHNGSSSTASTTGTARGGSGYGSGVSLDGPWIDQYLVSRALGYDALTLLQSVGGAGLLPPLPALMCPPYCPSTVPIGALPLAVADPATTAAAASLGAPLPEEPWMGVVVPAAVRYDSSVASLASTGVGASGAGAAAVEPLFDPRLPPPAGGLFFSTACTAASAARAGRTAWTDPSESPGVCTNASAPGFADCPFGEGDDCVACPTASGGRPAAACPGGFRALPLTGFYATSETSGVIAPCASPNSRCAGWNASAGAVQCAVGYLPYSPGCAACSPGYAVAVRTGRCEPCPPPSSLSPLVRAGLLFAGVLIACFAVVFAIAFIAAKVVGGTVTGGFTRVIDLVANLVAMLQLLAQAGRLAPPGLPEPVANLFIALRALQLGEDPSMPSACWPGYAFKSEVTLMGVALGLAGIIAFLMLLRGCGACTKPAPAQSPAEGKRARRASAASARPPCCAAGGLAPFLAGVLLSVSFTLLALLYAAATNAAFKLLSCTSQALSPLAYAALDGSDDGGGIAQAAAQWAASPDGTVTVSLLTSNPTFICWRGSHAPGGIVAAVCVAVVVVGFPLFVLLWTSRRIARLTSATLARELQLKSPAKVAAVVKGSPASAANGGRVAGGSKSAGAATSALWELHRMDNAALAALLRANPRCGRTMLCLCGREGFVQRYGVQLPPAAQLRKPTLGGPAAPSTEEKGGPGSPGAVAAGGTPRGQKDRDAQQQQKEKEKERAAAVAFAAPGLLVAHAKNTCSAVVDDAALRPFVGASYRASAAYVAVLAGIVLTAILAALQAFWPHPDSEGAAAGRGVVYVAALLAAAWLVGTRDPYHREDDWKRWVQVAALLLSALSAVLFHVSLGLDARFGSPPDPEAVASAPDQYARGNRARAALSYAVLIGCAALFLTLVAGFVYAVVRDARREPLQAAVRAKQHAATLESAAAAAGSRVQRVEPSQPPTGASARGPGSRTPRKWLPGGPESGGGRDRAGSDDRKAGSPRLDGFSGINPLVAGQRGAAGAAHARQSPRSGPLTPPPSAAGGGPLLPPAFDLDGDGNDNGDGDDGSAYSDDDAGDAGGSHGRRHGAGHRSNSRRWKDGGGGDTLQRSVSSRAAAAALKRRSVVAGMGGGGGVGGLMAFRPSAAPSALRMRTAKSSVVSSAGSARSSRASSFGSSGGRGSGSGSGGGGGAEGGGGRGLLDASSLSPSARFSIFGASDAGSAGPGAPSARSSIAPLVGSGAGTPSPGRAGRSSVMRIAGAVPRASMAPRAVSGMSPQPQPQPASTYQPHTPPTTTSGPGRTGSPARPRASLAPTTHK